MAILENLRAPQVPVTAATVTPTPLDPEDDFVRPDVAAPIVKSSLRTLERWRASGCGPRFYVLNNKVFYRLRDLMAYREAQASDKTET